MPSSAATALAAGHAPLTAAGLAAAEPTAVEPTAVEPTAVEPTAVEPTAVEPTAVEPTAVEPTAVEPAPRAWVARGALSILDHALVAGANFVVGLLLARWLDPAAFGAFAVALSALLFLAAFHDALVLEPTSVLGPVRYAGRLGGYFHAGVSLHARATAGAGAALVVAGAIAAWAGNGALGGALAAAGVAAPAVLLLWLARRFLYVMGRPGRAAAGSALYVVALLGAMILARTGGIDPVAGFVSMGVAALVASIPLLRAAGVRRDDGIAWRPVFGAHWRYGRWIALTTVLYTAAMQAQIVVTGALLGLRDAGTLRAMQVITLPMTHAATAIAAVALPVLSRARDDRASLRRKSRVVMGALVACAVTYEAVLILTATPLERLLYGGKFAASAWLIPVLGAVPVFGALAVAASLPLRALERPQYYVVTAAVALPVALASGLGMTWAWGLAGAAASAVVTAAATAAGTLALARRYLPAKEAA